MTTQSTMVSLITQSGDMAIDFNATSTDDAWNEQTDRVNSLSLYKVMPGSVIDRYMGSYALGCGCFRIRNTATNVVKAIELLSKAGDELVYKLAKPVKVVENDVVEVFCTAENS